MLHLGLGTGTYLNRKLEGHFLFLFSDVLRVLIIRESLLEDDGPSYSPVKLVTRVLFLRKTWMSWSLVAFKGDLLRWRKA